MLLSQIVKKLEEIAPANLGLSRDVYGLQFGSKLKMDKRPINKVLIALDPTKLAIAEAVKVKANLMITHHGLVHHPVMEFNDDLMDKIRLLSEHRINLWVMHTAWDAAQSGVSESFAQRCGLKIVDSLNFQDGPGRTKAIGRICIPHESMTLGKFAQRIKTNLDISYCKVYGKPEDPITKIALGGGHGITKESILTAIEKDCDCYLTGEISYKEVLDAKTLGINLIETSHYSSEFPGMESLYRTLCLEFPRTDFILFKEEENVQFL
jgi:dinuclear metal center YbgI/SA1388 family protein